METGLDAYLTLLAAAGAGVAACVIERRKDVLYGPYMERGNGAHPTRRLLWNSLGMLDGLRWQARNMISLAVFAAL